MGNNQSLLPVWRHNVVCADVLKLIDWLRPSVGPLFGHDWYYSKLCPLLCTNFNGLDSKHFLKHNRQMPN